MLGLFGMDNKIKFWYRKHGLKVQVKIFVDNQGNILDSLYYRRSIFSRWGHGYIGYCLSERRHRGQLNKKNVILLSRKCMNFLISDFRQEKQMKKTRLQILKLKKQMRGKYVQEQM